MTKELLETACNASFLALLGFRPPFHGIYPIGPRLSGGLCEALAPYFKASVYDAGCLITCEGVWSDSVVFLVSGASLEGENRAAEG